MLDAVPGEVNAVIEANSGGLKADVIARYHEHSTDAELKDRLRFYFTDLGKKTVRVMPIAV